MDKWTKAEVLLEIANALNEGAAGPTDYWFKRLAERLIERADKITSHSSGSEKDRSA